MRSLSRDKRVGSFPRDQRIRSLHRPEGGGHFQDGETEVSAQRSQGEVMSSLDRVTSLRRDQRVGSLPDLRD